MAAFSMCSRLRAVICCSGKKGFDKGRDVVPSCNDVDPPIRRADVAPDQFEAAACQPGCGGFLAPGADSLIVPRHERNLSNIPLKRV